MALQGPEVGTSRGENKHRVENDGGHAKRIMHS